MATYTVFRRDLVLSDAMQAALDASVTDEHKAAPGQLRRKGDWYFLTYLKVVKVKNFDGASFEFSERELDCVRAVSFQLKGSKLLVHGGKSEIKEIQEYLNALTLQVASASEEQTINHDQYYKLREPEIDLGALVEAFESKGTIENVRKLCIKDLEVKLGSVRRALINTSDYGGVRKVLEQPDNHAIGVELMLRNPEKTYVYLDVDGQVRVASYATDTDLDIETMTAKIAAAL